MPYGSGKTPPIILRLGDLCPPHRALIVTTSGTVYKWYRELKAWGDPEWAIALLVGKRDARIEAFNQPHNVAIINYEGLRVMLESLGHKFAKNYPVQVYDEIHRAKATETALSIDSATMAHPDNADYVYGSTGSPVLESPLDLFSILRIINPWIFGTDFEAFRARYFEKVSTTDEEGVRGFPKWQPKAGAVEFLAGQLHAISFRREKEECEVDYPQQFFDNPIIVELEGRTRQVYDDTERRLALMLTHQTISLVNIYPRLEKLCQLSRGWAYDRDKRALYYPERPALGAFVDHMEEVGGNAQTVVWAVRPPDMAMLAHALDKMGKSYVVVHGQIRSLKEREKRIEAYNGGAFDCMISHPRCIGEGVDLQADHSFRYSYRWSAMEWDQPPGRIARMSSNALCVRYKEVVVRGTLDEGIMRSVRSKLDIGELIKKHRRLPWRKGIAGGILDGVSS